MFVPGRRTELLVEEAAKLLRPGAVVLDLCCGSGAAATVLAAARGRAEAARPALGDAGFPIMAVAAMLSTAGATNATLYASSNLTGMLAKEGLFPPRFGLGPRLGPRLGPKSGLLITVAVVLVVANVTIARALLVRR